MGVATKYILYCPVYGSRGGWYVQKAVELWSDPHRFSTVVLLWVGM